MRVFLLLLFSAGVCLADDVDTLIGDLKKEIAAERTALASLRKTLSDEREALHVQLAEAETKRTAAATRIRTLQQKTDALDVSIDTLTSRRDKANDTLTRCLTLIRETRKDLQTPVGLAAPTQRLFASIDKELNKQAPQAELLLESISKDFLEHVDRCTRMEQTSEPVILPDGESEPSAVLRLGGVAAYCIEPGRLGILEPVPDESKYRLVPVSHNKSFRSSLEQAADASAALRLPVDVSGGRGLKRMAQSKSLMDFLKAGGPVVIPLIILGLLALIMVIERTLFLLKVDKNLDRMLDTVLPALEKSDFDGAMSQVEGKRGPVANVVRSALDQGRDNNDKLEELLQEGILAELPALERFLGALAVMAAAAPLLGLLGTVSGMIGTFDVISSYGTGNARMLSGGISEALITTEIGLIIAVPILLAHAFLNRQVRIIVGHMDRAALSLAGTIRHAKTEDGSS